MKVLSLFDGMSCGQIALERLGIEVETYYASEIEPKAIEITQKNYPNTIQLGDVTKLRNLPGIDLLLAGSPCQSVSPLISYNTGLKGKSSLFYEFVRVLKETQPEYWLLENVKMKPEWEQEITDMLGVEPIFINSSHFSAQSRPRLYWTNIPQAALPEANTDVLIDIMVPVPEVPQKAYYKKPWKFESTNKAVCGQLLVNTTEMCKRIQGPLHKCPTLTQVRGGYQEKKVFDTNGPRKLLPIEYERLQTVPDNYTEGVSDTARYSMLGNGWTVDVICHILGSLRKMNPIKGEN